MAMGVRLPEPWGSHTSLDTLRKLCQEHDVPGRDLSTVVMIRWLAATFRYLLMSRTERYLEHAIDRSDFERRLRVVRQRI